MEGPSVCHIHNAGELACIKVLSLQEAHYRQIFLLQCHTEASAAAQLPFGQACLLLSTAFSSPVLPVGGVNKWWGGSGQGQL